MSSLILLLWKRSRAITLLALVCGALSGVATAALLSLIDRALTRGVERWGLLWGFAGLAGLVLVSRAGSQLLTILVNQDTLQQLRMLLSRRILATPLRQLEQTGVHRLLTMLADDVTATGLGLMALPLTIINAAVLVGCVGYLAWLSWPLLLGILGFMVVGLGSFRFLQLRSMEHQREARRLHDELMKHQRSMLEGLKELMQHRLRRFSFLQQELGHALATGRRLHIRSAGYFVLGGNWSLLLLLLAIGLLLFAAPRLLDIPAQTLTSFTLVVLYMRQPLEGLMGNTQTLTTATISLRNIQALALAEPEPDESLELLARKQPRSFRRLELRGVTHTYQREHDDGRFSLGPIDLTFEPGEVVFLVGGNGSGKTSLAKVLTGLYAPEQGELLLDGQVITPELREHYRQHFSAIFSDFFLFERLLGLAPAEVAERVQAYLAELQLQHKVRVTGGAFSTVQLSQGQRKRLALLAAYLEDRPFYVFDEWAADQDPLFKKVFYTQLLPELKARGKTVLAITHDDHYLSCADRVLLLESGQLVPPRRSVPLAAEPLSPVPRSRHGS